MLHYLLIGIVLGLSAGFAPGPLLALVITETLRNDTRAGIKVAVAPLVTDIPIVGAAIFLSRQLSEAHLWLGLISLAGASFLVFLGSQSFRFHPLRFDDGRPNSRSMTRGVLTNFLSPHPYLFWIGVGAPTMAAAMEDGLLGGSLFIAGFYVCLIGAKLFLAVIAGYSKVFLSGSLYMFIMRFLGVLILLLASMLYYEGFRLLGLF